MPQNKLIDLNNHLFEQLERINDEDLTEEELACEIKRTKAMCNIGKVIVSNAKIVLEAQKYFTDNNSKAPSILALDNKSK